MKTTFPPPTTRWARALVLLLAAAPAAAQRAQAILPDDASSVTIPLESDEDYIVLPISINGSEPLPILLDTGMPAPGIALFHGPHVEQLDLDYLPMRAQIGGAGGSARYEARISVDATFEIGAARIEGSRLIVMPPIPHFDLGYAGIIGLGILEAFTLSVDRDAQQVVLTRPEAFEPPEGATEVPLEMLGNKPYVEARVPGREGEDETVQLVLDLGAHHAVSLNVARAGVPIPEASVERQVGRGLSGPIRGRLGRMSALELGGHRLESVVASFRDPQTADAIDGGRDGNLGVGAMNRFHFTLDYANRVLYLLPSERFGDPFEADMSGLLLEAEDGESLRVAEVLPGYPAAAAGLAVGDAVLEVDGAEVGAQDRILLRARLRRPGPLVLRVQREGSEPRTVELELRRRI